MPKDLAELQARLHSLASDARIAAERKALRAVGTLVQTAIVERAPQQSSTPHGELAPGELKADIKARVHIATDENAATDVSRVTIGPTSKTAYVANFVENGHANRPRNKPSSRARKENTPAHPFIRPAQDATQQKAIDLYAEIMAAEIQKVMNGESS